MRGTTTVRVFKTDVQRIRKRSGLDPSAQFAAHFRHILDRAEQASNVEACVRRAVREELEGLA